MRKATIETPIGVVATRRVMRVDQLEIIVTRIRKMIQEAAIAHLLSQKREKMKRIAIEELKEKQAVRKTGETKMTISKARFKGMKKDPIVRNQKIGIKDLDQGLKEIETMIDINLGKREMNEIITDDIGMIRVGKREAETAQLHQNK